MAEVLMFAAARQIAGEAAREIPGSTVRGVLDSAVERYGAPFADVLAVSRIWINGRSLGRSEDSPCSDRDEIAVLPPISGG
ncbi:MoaD/ThiS family protein [Rhodococcus sp. 15-2388-1-1a]|jgi:molybdopterin converting factor small subunit|uniref:MoaD/ThiS family protein n=1 Tax=Nocardiaceae TaxID=85025 RepID=UPI00055A03AB|nr:MULTISPECIES: MoaD/ThiS family protein [Rhodococcus]OZE93653.1 MoaD/ThiS family protein [Rhodococcus sp. 15-2388-1-1a]OZF40279.1 MoaD/ThiS family protein [Rhodococcus sp. 14-2483-1-2]